MLEDSSSTVLSVETAFFSASAKGRASAKPYASAKEGCASAKEGCASAKEGRASAIFDLEAKLLAIRLDPKGVAALIKAERRAED